MKYKKRNVAVVIPVYKETPNANEYASFCQTLKIFSKRDIILITFRDLCLDQYDQVADKYGVKLKFIFFDSIYFSGTKSYNHLLMSDFFYQAFSQYEFILICHWDSWVFEDLLDFWCSKNYDIIGAPWFKWDSANNCFVKELTGTSGNGGFTLRKVSYFINVLSSNDLVRSFSILKKELYWKSFKSILRFLMHLAGWHNTPKYYTRLCREDNEDVFWSQKFIGTRFAPSLPKLEDAISFAFEMYPSYLYFLNNNKLPFGCHKYLNNEFDTFWCNYIKDDINDNNKK